METETALVGTEGRVELNTISTVDLELALVVLPSNTELNHALGDGNDGKSSLELGGDLEELGVGEARLELCNSNEKGQQSKFRISRKRTV